MEWFTEVSVGHIPNHTRLAAALGLAVQAFVMFYLYFSKRNVLKGAFAILVFALFAAVDFLLKVTVLLHVQDHWLSQILYVAVTLLSTGVVLHTWSMVKVCKYFYTPFQLEKDMVTMKGRLSSFQAAMIRCNRFDGLTKQFADLEHSFKRLEETINAHEAIRRESDFPYTGEEYSSGSDTGVHPGPR